ERCGAQQLQRDCRCNPRPRCQRAAERVVCRCEYRVCESPCGGLKVGGLEGEEHGTLTFRDGIAAGNKEVTISNGAPTATTVDLSGMKDGPVTASRSVSDAASNSFKAKGSATLDRDTGEQTALQLTVNNGSTTPISAAAAINVPFNVSGIEPDDTGTIT